MFMVLGAMLRRSVYGAAIYFVAKALELKVPILTCDYTMHYVRVWGGGSHKVINPAENSPDSAAPLCSTQLYTIIVLGLRPTT